MSAVAFRGSLAVIVACCGLLPGRAAIGTATASSVRHDSYDAASRRQRATGQVQEAPQWIFVAVWPAQTGPAAVTREELRVDGSRQSWRRIGEREVQAASDSTVRRVDGVARLRSIAASTPPVSRSRGSRSRTVDAPLDRYLQIVIGRGDRFTEWSDDQAFLPAPLVTAALNAVASARPSRPVPPSAGSAWLQVVAADPTIAALFESEGRVTALSSEQIAAAPALDRALRSPYAWVPLPSGTVSLAERSVLDQANPVGLVRVHDVVFQIILQRSAR